MTPCPYFRNPVPSTRPTSPDPKTPTFISRRRPPCSRCRGLRSGCWNSIRGACLLVGRILLLRRVERDVDGFLFFRDVEDLPEGLEAFGDHLDADLALRNLGDLGLAVLVGPQFVGGAEFLDIEDGMLHLEIVTG